MSNELLEMVMDEMPDAFRGRGSTAAESMRQFVEFYQAQVKELQEAYTVLPDGLNRPLRNRIEMLTERANSEAYLAVKLRQRLEELKPGSSSDI